MLDKKKYTNCELVKKEGYPLMKKKSMVKMAMLILTGILIVGLSGLYAGTEVQDVINMENKAYEKHTKWSTRLPKSSILSYNVTDFDFDKTSALQKRQEKEAKEMAVTIKNSLEEAKTIQETNKIHTAAQIGNMELVRSMLDAGVDVDVLNYDRSGTPLVFAVIGSQVEMVRFLISRGADVNFKADNAASVLEQAKIFKNRDIIKMLKNAGAK